MENSKIDWGKYKSHEPTMKPNKLNIPVNNIGFNDEGIVEFNKLYQYCLEKENSGEFHNLILTKSKGICIAAGKLRGACWVITVKKSFIELLIRNLDARYYRFLVGYKKDKSTGLSGKRAFQIYVAELLKDKVNINDLAIEDGEEVKKTIPAPKIDLVDAIPERTYSDVHHIDLNSAFNAGMMEAFPVLETSVRRMYNKRKVHEYFKDVLNMTQGFMQSELIDYKFSHISKAGYVYTNRRIEELTERLRVNGNRVLSYNTDGIWYQGTKYHDNDEGPDIGQWKHDYVDCKIRYRSRGAYEIEGIRTKDGKYLYKPVVRGETTYEKLVPREQWVWGDIFKGYMYMVKFIEGVGLVKNADYTREH